LQFAAGKIPSGGWNNIQNIVLKTPDSAALPIFNKDREKNKEVSQFIKSKGKVDDDSDSKASKSKKQDTKKEAKKETEKETMKVTKKVTEKETKKTKTKEAPQEEEKVVTRQLRAGALKKVEEVAVAKGLDGVAKKDVKVGAKPKKAAKAAKVDVKPKKAAAVKKEKK